QGRVLRGRSPPATARQLHVALVEGRNDSSCVFMLEHALRLGKDLLLGRQLACVCCRVENVIGNRAPQHEAEASGDLVLGQGEGAVGVCRARNLRPLQEAWRLEQGAENELCRLVQATGGGYQVALRDDLRRETFDFFGGERTAEEFAAD